MKMIWTLKKFLKIIKIQNLPIKHLLPKTLVPIKLTLNLKMTGSNVIYVMKLSYLAKCIKSQIMARKLFAKSAIKDLKKA